MVAHWLTTTFFSPASSAAFSCLACSYQLLELLGQACITSVPSQGRVVMAGDLLEVLVPTKARPLVVRDGVKQTYRALAREYFSLCSRMAQKFWPRMVDRVSGTLWP